MELSGNKVKLQANDSEEGVEVPVEWIDPVKTVKDMLDDFGGVTEVPIPLPSVNKDTLDKIVEYMKFDFENPLSYDGVDNDDDGDDPMDVPKRKYDDLTDWEKEYCNTNVDRLCELISAANYLNYRRLLDTTAMTIAESIKGKTPEEIRTYFNIKNDFTPEEEEQIRKENEWATT